jgi:hypothetical protein
LKLQSYRFQAVQQLQQWNKAARVQYCHWLHCFVREEVRVLLIMVAFDAEQLASCVYNASPNMSDKSLHSDTSVLFSHTLLYFA